MSDTATTTDTVVTNPTYMANIRFFFRQVDIEHMQGMGIDLSTYDGVKRNALGVLAQTSPSRPQMPPPEVGGQWTQERWQTFRNWITTNYPMGTATPVETPVETPVGTETPTRQRKDVTTLSDDEWELVKKAFTGLMARDPSTAASYYALAAPHGLPQRWCAHHEGRYNPWHRQFLLEFEDAMRSVPGCEQVTLPYWDVSTPFPDRLQQSPFDSYALPLDPGAAATPPRTGYANYVTQHYPSERITQELTTRDVVPELATALTQSVWGESDVNGYQDFSIQAHDGGHLSVGPAMRDQNVSSYDPAFWFYHCNLDRHWLSWQTRIGGTTLPGFLSTVTGNTDWLLTPPFNALPPFTVPADQTIVTEVTYDRLEVPPQENDMENLAGSIEAGRTFAVSSSSPVSVRVKGIDRLNIPGAFDVHLLADGEPIATRGFFQPTDPRACTECVKKAAVNIDFRLPLEVVADRALSVRIEVPDQADAIGMAAFPLAQAGNPTVNVRLLVQDA